MAYRVLVVDDEETLRTLLCRVLRRDGFQCDEAEDGAVALQLLKQHQFDAMITDLAMPNVHGHKLVIEALELKPAACVVVYTGVIDRRLAEDLFARGVADVIYKPMPLDFLSVKLNALIERHRAAKD